jgi:hypothetical protein
VMAHISRLLGDLHHQDHAVVRIGIGKRSDVEGKLVAEDGNEIRHASALARFAEFLIQPIAQNALIGTRRLADLCLELDERRAVRCDVGRAFIAD